MEVTKRFYSRIPPDMKRIREFTEALQTGKAVRFKTQVLTVKGYTVYPDGVEFKCIDNVELGLFNQNTRIKRKNGDLNSLV